MRLDARKSVSRFTLPALLLIAAAACTSGTVREPEALTRNAAAGESLPRPNSSADVFDRLLEALEAIPTRWDGIRSPLIAPAASSRSEPPALLPSATTEDPFAGEDPWRDNESPGPSSVASVPSQEDLADAQEFIVALAATPLSQQSERIAREIRLRRPTEADLWVPAQVVRSQAKISPQAAALVVEAWLQWAEALKSRDALLAAASAALDLAIPRKDLVALKALSATWVRQASKEPRSRGKARLMRAQGEILFRFGDHAEALDAYRSARRLFSSLGDRQGQGRTWVGEGDTLLRMGENEKAIAAYQAAGRLSHGSPGGLGDSLKGEADVLARLGEDERAFKGYQTARAEYEKGGFPAGMGYTWIGEGDLLLRHQRLRDAFQAYGEAESLFRRAELGNGEGSAVRGQADVLFVEGRYGEALKAYEKALELHSRAESLHGKGSALLGVARVGLAQRNWPSAAEAARTAGQLFTARELLPDRIQALLLQAQAESALGQEDAAFGAAEAAIRLHRDRFRQSAITDAHRTALDEPISRAYDIVVPAWASRPGHSTEALSWAEEARSRVLLDLLATGNPKIRRVPSRLEAQQKAFRAELSRVEEALSSTADPRQRKVLMRQIDELGQRLQWNSYERIAAASGSFPAAIPLTGAEIKKLAGKSGPILHYYAAPGQLWGFLILPDQPEIVAQKIELSRASLTEKVRSLAHDFANPLYEARAREKARVLWDLLIAPFAGSLPKNGHLVLVPHGPLHELSFEALLDPSGEPLFQRWQTSISPSVSALAYARKRRSDPREDDAFVAFAAGRSLSLPAQEIDEISRFFRAGSSAFRPTVAQFQSYERFVVPARQLLIATRGIHVQGSRTATYLEIQPTPGVHDGRLTAAEIASIELKAELVTLAACDTSHGSALLSDERLDLTRAFLIAGAAAVLATRWKVPEDTSTSRFLADFYQAYRLGGSKGKGMRKDEALSVARRLSRERGDPAQVWAAWVLVGDGR